MWYFAPRDQTGGIFARVRSRYRNELFSTYVYEVRERRQRHGLGGDFHLLSYSEQQSQQKNWVEFHNYHLKRHERLEKKRDGLMKEFRSRLEESR